MPTLPNARHELFAQSLAAGKTADEAYKDAGFHPHSGNASRLRVNESIVARVAELQSRVAEGVVLTKQWIIERLIDNVNRAARAVPVLDSKGNETGDYVYQGSVVNRALELLGKERGMFVDRKEVGIPGEFKAIEEMTLDELRAFAGTETEALGLRSKEASKGRRTSETGSNGRLN